MPLYEYKCAACGASKEELRPYDERDNQLPRCDCGPTGVVMRRQMPAPYGVVKNPAVPKRIK